MANLECVDAAVTEIEVFDGGGLRRREVGSSKDW